MLRKHVVLTLLLLPALSQAAHAAMNDPVPPTETPTHAGPGTGNRSPSIS